MKIHVPTSHSTPWDAAAQAHVLINESFWRKTSDNRTPLWLCYKTIIQVRPCLKRLCAAVWEEHEITYAMFNVKYESFWKRQSHKQKHFFLNDLDGWDVTEKKRIIRSTKAAVRGVNIIWVFLYSAYPRVSSKRFKYIHTHTTGYATWVTLESLLHNSDADQSFPVSFSRASFSIYSSLIFHMFFCLLSFISRSKSSLWTPNYQAYQYFFNFDGGGTRSVRRKPPVRDPRRNFLLYVQLI
jgi:hypothetical protein